MKPEYSSKSAETGQRLNTAEAAKYIGISPSSMSKWRVFGGGPKFYKLSRRVVYDTRDLDAFLQSRGRVSTCDPGNIARLP